MKPPDDENTTKFQVQFNGTIICSKCGNVVRLTMEKPASMGTVLISMAKEFDRLRNTHKCETDRDLKPELKLVP